jgi:hypothetical protein
MHEKLHKARLKNPNIDREFMDEFSEIMPELLDVMLEGKEYDWHIGTQEVAMLAEQFIKNKKGENIGFHWTYEDVINASKNFITDIDKEAFYMTDLWVWANVRYGDLSEQREEVKPLAIFEFAVNDLSADDDYPFYDSSQKAYRWLKKAIENKEKY